MISSVRTAVGRWNAWRSRSAHGPMLGATLTVGAITAVVKVAGAVKLIAIAQVFGTADALDAFLIAFLIPSFLAEMIGGSFAAALIPVYIEIREREGRAAAQRLISGAFFLATLLLGAAAAFTLLARVPLLAAVASGFSPAKLALASSLLIWMLPAVILIGKSIVWRAVLNAGGHFALPAGAPAITPVLTIVLLASPLRSWGAYVLAAGALAGTALELAVVWIGLRRQGLRAFPVWQGWSHSLHVVIRQFAPMLAATVLGGGAVLIDSAFAATLGSGSVSALNYGTKLAAVLLSIGPLAISTAALPHFSTMAASGNSEEARSALGTYSKLMILVTVPVTLMLILLSNQFTRVMFQRGAFARSDAQLVSVIQSCSFLQIPFAMLTALYARAVSSLKANRALLWGAGISLAANAVAGYGLMRIWGVPGIALARAVVALVSCVYLTKILHTLLRNSFPEKGTPTPARYH